VTGEERFATFVMLGTTAVWQAGVIMLCIGAARMGLDTGASIGLGLMLLVVGIRLCWG